MHRTLLAAAALVAATPATASPKEVAVVSVVWPGVIDAAAAERVEELVRGSLGQGGLPLLEASRARALRPEVSACAAKQECLAGVAARANALALVRVEPAALSGEILVLAQAIAASDGAMLRELSVTVRAGTLESELPRALEPLVAALRSRLEAHQSAATPSPVAGTGASPTAPPPEAELAKKEEPPSTGEARHPAGLVVGGVGLAAALGGLALYAGAGAVTKDAHGNVESSQASLVAGIQQRQAAGLGVAVGGALIAVVGGALWATWGPKAPVVLVPTLRGVAVAGEF